MPESELTIEDYIVLDDSVNLSQLEQNFKTEADADRQDIETDVKHSLFNEAVTLSQAEGTNNQKELTTNNIVQNSPSDLHNSTNFISTLEENSFNTTLENCVSRTNSNDVDNCLERDFAIAQKSLKSKFEHDFNTADNSTNLNSIILTNNFKNAANITELNDTKLNLITETRELLNVDEEILEKSKLNKFETELVNSKITCQDSLAMDKLTKEVRVLTLNVNEHQETTLYRLKTNWILQFRLGPSLFGRKINLYCNYPQDNVNFNRTKYQKINWSQEEGCTHSDDTASFAEIAVKLPGSFHYYYVYDNE